MNARDVDGIVCFVAILVLLGMLIGSEWYAARARAECGKVGMDAVVVFWQSQCVPPRDHP